MGGRSDQFNKLCPSKSACLQHFWKEGRGISPLFVSKMRKGGVITFRSLKGLMRARAGGG